MKNNKILILTSILILLIFTIAAIIWIKNKNSVSVFSKNEEPINIFDGINLEEANLTQYTVYGNHLNLNIAIDINNNLGEILDSNLILRNSKGQDVEYKMDYEIFDNNITFSTSDYINTGINLENFDSENYYIVLKLNTKSIENDDTLITHYYNLVNKTNYDNISYYTITKEESNKSIDIEFLEIPNNLSSTMTLYVTDTKLPEDVYDIVIDAGHGGEDTGASGNGYYESYVTLEYALLLKEKLEEYGLKVKLTRTENETRLPTYGEGGRYVIANEVKAKLLLSIHLNSCDISSVCGVEIYSPNNSDLTFSRMLANSLVKNAGSSYSPNNIWKVEDGVYVRTFSDEDIEESIEYANDNNFEPYNITNNTSYYGIIREAGGICTGAYVDGRNKIYGDNPYYNSNIGVETYLLEIGYITNKYELNNMLTNIETYTELIANNTIEYLGL